MFQRFYLLVCEAVWFSKMVGTFRGKVFCLLSICEIQADGTLCLNLVVHLPGGTAMTLTDPLCSGIHCSLENT